MNLIHSSLGWGMLLGTIPIIIYIIFRRRYRIVRWAAMELLLAAIRRKYRYVRLQDFILLALRTLALIVAALAIARPVLSRSQGGQGSNGPGSTSEAVLILDTSYSMSTTLGGQSRLDRAKRRAQAIVSALPQGSRVGVLYMTQKVVRATEGLTADIARGRMVIEAAEVTAEGTDALPAVTAALDMLKSSKAPAKRVFIVTDGQARAFESQIDKLRQTLAGTDDSVRFTVATTPDSPAENMTVSKLEVTSRWLRAGVPVEFAATVDDVGETAFTETHAELWVDGRKVDRKPVGLVNRKGSVSFRHTFTTSGTYGVEVRIDADAIDVDNHRYTAVCIPAAMDMLVVAPDKATANDGAGVFIEAAMNGGNEAGLDVPGLPWVVRPQIGRDRLASELDPSVWCVVLADPGRLSSDALERLDAFVQEGGSLLVAAGAESTATIGSLRSGRAGAAHWMSDLTVEPVASQPAGDKGFRQIQPEPLGPAVFDLASPGVRGSISAVHVFNAVTATPTSDSHWTTVLQFTDGRPAILVREAQGLKQRGRLALWTSSLDASWCDLPYRPAFVAMLHDLTAWLNRPRLVADSLLPGEMWSPIIPGFASRTRNAAANWKIVEPNGNRLEAALFVGSTDDANASILSVDRISRPGVYRLAQDAGDNRVTATALQAAAINVDTRESAPAVWSKSQFQELFPPQRLDVIGENDTLDAIAQAATAGREIWAVLAVFLGVLLLVETLLAYRFSYQKPVAPPVSHTRQPALTEGTLP